MKTRDIYAAPAPDNNMRCAQVYGEGIFCFARRHAEIYSVQILTAACGRAEVRDGTGRVLWRQPSLFTGSFMLGGFAKDGIILETQGEHANFLVNWREVPEVTARIEKE